jgi:hypothetical protein
MCREKKFSRWKVQHKSKWEKSEVGSFFCGTCADFLWFCEALSEFCVGNFQKLSFLFLSSSTVLLRVLILLLHISPLLGWYHQTLTRHKCKRQNLHEIKQIYLGKIINWMLFSSISIIKTKQLSGWNLCHRRICETFWRTKKAMWIFYCSV